MTNVTSKPPLRGYKISRNLLIGFNVITIPAMIIYYKFFIPPSDTTPRAENPETEDLAEMLPFGLPSEELINFVFAFFGFIIVNIILIILFLVFLIRKKNQAG